MTTGPLKRNRCDSSETLRTYREWLGKHDEETWGNSQKPGIHQLELFDNDDVTANYSITTTQPPQKRHVQALQSLGSLFAILMNPQQFENFMGDLEERYGLMLQQEGHRAATIWFWREVIHSCFSLAVDALKRLAALDKLIERYRRIGS